MAAQQPSPLVPGRPTSARLALDPDLPAEVSRVLRASPQILLEVRHGRTPAPSGPDRAVVPFLAITLIVALMAGGWRGGLTFLALFVLVTGYKRLTADGEERETRRRVRIVHEHADRYVLNEDLDADCRALLRRAQDATRAVLRSAVNRDGLLDTFDNAVTLPAQEWQIARRLADLSRLRTEHRSVVGDDVPDEFADAFRPFDEAIETATASVTARIEALERYAEQARNADRYYDGIRKLEILRERAPEYERVVAETAQDAIAVPQIERLSGHALAVEQVFRDSVDEAKRAATHLLGVTAAQDAA